MFLLYGCFWFSWYPRNCWANILSSRPWQWSYPTWGMPPMSDRWNRMMNYGIRIFLPWSICDCTNWDSLSWLVLQKCVSTRDTMAFANIKSISALISEQNNVLMVLTNTNGNLKIICSRITDAITVLTITQITLRWVSCKFNLIRIIFNQTHHFDIVRSFQYAPLRLL